MFGLFDKEGMVRDVIEASLENLAGELNCNHSELFLMIKPKNEDFDAIVYLYKIENGIPTPIREVPLKEILGD